MILERIHHSTVITATKEDEPIGFAVVSEWGDDLYLFRLSVRPEFRRRGIATAIIMDAVEMVCTAGEPRRLYLEPLPFDDKPMSLDDLVAWYARLGFCRDDKILDIGRSLMVYRGGGFLSHHGSRETCLSKKKRTWFDLEKVIIT